MFNLIIFLAAGIVLAVFGAYFVANYREAKGGTWQRLLASAKDSATVLWSYIVSFAGMVIVFADNAAEYFAFPEVQAFIKGHLSPTRVGVAMTVIAVITVIARLRTLQTR